MSLLSRFWSRIRLLVRGLLGITLQEDGKLHSTTKGSHSAHNAKLKKFTHMFRLTGLKNTQHHFDPAPSQN